MNKSIDSASDLNILNSYVCLHRYPCAEVGCGAECTNVLHPAGAFELLCGCHELWGHGWSANGSKRRLRAKCVEVLRGLWPTASSHTVVKGCSAPPVVHDTDVVYELDLRERLIALDAAGEGGPDAHVAIAAAEQCAAALERIVQRLRAKQEAVMSTAEGVRAVQQTVNYTAGLVKALGAERGNPEGSELFEFLCSAAAQSREVAVALYVRFLFLLDFFII